jgi:hypothetical protein
MAVDFLFEDPTKAIPTIATCKKHWQHIPDADVQRQICYEQQYLEFHFWLLRNIRSTESGCASNPRYTKELTLSLRAGAIKVAILLCASIAEAALRAHAEHRDYPLSSDPKKRTFGNVLKAWKDCEKQPRTDVAPIWDKLMDLYDSRNNVHLHEAAVNADAGFVAVLAKEETIFNNVKDILKHLRTLKSSAQRT